MLITDVIRRADSEHEIYFLLTAYVEAVRYCDGLLTFPEHMTSLPLAGIPDVRARANALRVRLHENRTDDSAEVKVIEEAADILGAALGRLECLDEEKRRSLAEAAGHKRFVRDP